MGARIRPIRRTISEGESMRFNSLVMDHHPDVSGERFAVEEGVFGRRLVAGAIVFSLGLGLAATNCLNSFSYGYDRLRFIKPVFIGDTIYTIRENLSKQVHDLRMGKLRVSYSVQKGEGVRLVQSENSSGSATTKSIGRTAGRRSRTGTSASRRVRRNRVIATSLGQAARPMCAMAVIIIVPALAMTFLVQKHLIAGLTFGGVKG